MDHLRGRLDLLVPLNALLETAHITRAAQRTGLSQPAMSRILSRLRLEFDDPLLVRVGSQMRLTPRASSLRAPLHRVLQAAEALYARVLFDPVAATRTFTAVIPDVVAATILPPLLERMSKEAPNCRLRLFPWRADRQHMNVDFVITTEVDLYPELRMQPLFEDIDVLASREPPPVGVDPLSLDHVAVITAGLSDDPVDRWLSEQGKFRKIKTVVSHYLLALQLVSRSSACAILPSRMVSALGPALGVQATMLDIEQSADQQWLLYPAENEADPASMWIRNLVMTVASRME